MIYGPLVVLFVLWSHRSIVEGIVWWIRVVIIVSACCCLRDDYKDLANPNNSVCWNCSCLLYFAQNFVHMVMLWFSHLVSSFSHMLCNMLLMWGDIFSFAAFSFNVCGTCALWDIVVPLCCLVCQTMFIRSLGLFHAWSM